MRRASIHEQYDVGTGESASRTGDYGTSGTGGTNGTSKTGGTSGTGETSGTGGTGETSETSGTGETGETNGNKKKLLLVRQLNFLLYTNYLIIHHLHQSSLKTL